MKQHTPYRGWIGVDLDGTLAVYTTWKGVTHIGEPISEMVERVKRWLADGYEVRILTARAYAPSYANADEAADVLLAIEQWCLKHIGQILPITCNKDMMMLELWDDRAVQVEPNTGKLLGRSTHGLN